MTFSASQNHLYLISLPHSYKNFHALTVKISYPYKHSSFFVLSIFDQESIDKINRQSWSPIPQSISIPKNSPHLSFSSIKNLDLSAQFFSALVFIHLSLFYRFSSKIYRQNPFILSFSDYPPFLISPVNYFTFKFL